jgi:copper resistance protein B
MNAMSNLKSTCRPQLLATALATLLAPLTAWAQHAGHVPAQAPPAQQAQSDKPEDVKQETAEEMDHSAMDHSAMDHSMTDESTTEDSTMDHSTMDHSTMGLPATVDPLTPIPEVTDADRAAAVAPEENHPVHDNGIFHYVLFNRLEAWDADAGTGLAWEGQSWIGTDLNRLWLRSEGEQVNGELDSADLEVLYGHSVSAWWDVVAGVRHDFKPGASQDFLAIGVIGLAPYKFEVEATAYLGESGQTAARMEVEYETLLTNRLILQPLLEAEFHGKDDEMRGIGSGLSTAEFGLRLRYEIRREFAPYIGIVRERAFGQTARYREQDGHPSDDTRVVAGFRIWF